MKSVGIAEIIHYVTLNRGKGRDWAFFSIKRENDSIDVSNEEVQQFMQQQFLGFEGSMYSASDGNYFIAVFYNKEHALLSGIERTAQIILGSKSFHFTSADLTEMSLPSLIRILTAMKNAENPIVDRLLVRLTRQGNMAMVLDDDMMVLKIMENILKDSCDVRMFQDPDTFQNAYLETMPNIIFVDIHLKKARGYDVVKYIRENIDPYVHAVMISSDATKDTVMAAKEVVVSGYLVKPFNKEAVYNQLIKAPTYQRDA